MIPGEYVLADTPLAANEGRRTLELTNRERIEEFIGNEDRRSKWNRRQVIMPSHLDIG